MPLELFRIVVVGMLLLIVFNLGSALFHLTTERGGTSDKEKSAKLLRALTWRIALSVGLFLFILFAYWQGWIHPHGVGR